MAEKTKIIKTRGVQRGQITKLQSKLRDILHKPELNEDDHDTLVAALETYQDKLDVIADLDKRLIDLVPEEELEQFLEESDDYATEIKQQYVIYERQVSRKFQPTNFSHNEVTSTEFVNTGNKTINLPKLSLKSFDGNILEWIEFHDSFKSAIDSNTSLSNVQKFQYLRAQVTGEAARAINGLSLTDNNYAHAMEILKTRYGQTHKIISAYMRALWELAKPDHTLESLRDFYDALESYIRGLSTLGKNEDSYGDLLVPVVLDKLPPAIRKQMARDHGNNEWNITDLRVSLQKEIEAILASEVNVTTTFEENTVATGAFHTSAYQSRQREPRKQMTQNPRKNYVRPRAAICAFCKGDHLSSQCAVISDKKRRHEVVVRDRLCFNCLGKHRAAECRSRNRCRTCKRKHHTSLCTVNDSDTALKTYVTTDNAVTPSPPVEAKVSLANLSGPVVLKTAIADVHNGSNSLKVVILFDEGAQRSFVTQEVADMLNTNREENENVQITAFGGTTGVRNLQVAKFTLQSVDQSDNVDIRALVVPKISTPIRNHVKPSVFDLPYLRGLQLAHPYTHTDMEEISVLIGADYYWSIVGDHIVRGPGPTAVSSKLGYLLSGPTSSSSKNQSPNSTATFHINIDTHRNEEINLQRFWDLETVGVQKAELNTVVNHTDYRNTHIRRENGRFVAKLPWRKDHSPLPTNRHLAEKRTRAMVQRLSPDMRKIYDDIINTQLSNDHIERVENDDIMSGHYLPHRAVKSDSVSTPLRVVYNCSCSTRDTPSLNDCLQTGPSLFNDLSAIMLRFRVHKFAITSDIQRAFLQIGLDADDRKFTKFFWLSDHSDPESELKIYQFKVVLFGAVCSPFILNATVRNHLETSDSPTASDLSQNIYVDNVVSGCDSAFDAIRYYDEANEIMLDGGFQLHSWSTNCSELRQYAKPDNLLDTKPVVNVLGILWNTETDCIAYRKRIATRSKDNIVTKRTAVKETASIYDPLGYLAPVHVRAKLFIQDLWKSKYDWDQLLPDELVRKWYDIDDDLASASKTSIDRKLVNREINPQSQYELHAFADASKVAYGCVVYIRDIDQETTSIVMSKSRVAPVKELTVPQLELLAALIASNVMNYVYKSIAQIIPISKRILWSDSQIVLHWINSDKKLPLFVANRLKVIKSNSVDAFKYCPTNNNPADLISRGTTASDFSQSEIWWKGPSWLAQGDWPICHLFDSAVLAVGTDTECPSKQAKNSSPKPTLLTIINPENYSSLSKLYRVTAYVLRFIRYLTSKQRPQTRSLSAREMNDAENTWLKHIQQSYYLREIDALRDDKQKNKNALVRQLRLFRDDKGILRVGSRLHNAPIQYDAKFPILLPPDITFTKLVIRDAHCRILHAGPESTMTFVRQTFWVTKMRQTVKSVLRKCVQCKRVTGLPYALPETAPLQACRLKEAPPFTVCGLDYTGVLYVKSKYSNKREEKAYILLFTCANTRAVHLETVGDLTTGTFLHAFRRFAARRSLPRKLISDNASTFLSAGEELQKLLNSIEVREYMTNHRVDWSVITKRAPWHGGFWEKLIGVTKTALKKVLGRTFITLEELTTVVTEIETVINNRPITYYSSDINDPTPLTPSHLLHGRVLTNLPHMDITDEQINDPTFGNIQIALEKRARRLAMLRVHFWQRWTKEYVTTLREKHISSRKRIACKTDNVIKAGDVVLVHGENKNRVNWELALVQELIYGNDNLVRSARIKMKNGVTNRPINKLYPLEVSCTPDTTLAADTNVNDNTDMTVPVPSKRPVREAALNAKQKLKLLSE